MLISKSISNRKLHCCLLVLILFILIFLSIPLLLIFLANSRYEEWENQRASQVRLGAPHQQHQHQQQQPSTSAAPPAGEARAQANGHCNQTISDENFHCPIGAFPCQSCPEICIEQVRQCDGQADCPDKSDESSCHDSNGAMGIYYKKIVDLAKKNNQRRPPTTAAAAPVPAASPASPPSASSSASSSGGPLAKPETCTMDQFEREQCPCNLTDSRVVICEEIGLERVPNTLLSSVYKLRLSNNSIGSIDQVQWPRSLTSLVLVGNRLQSLSARTFELAPNLSKLYLTNNQIRRLDGETFAPGLRHLSSLQMENNLLESFDSRALRYAPQLVKIYLSENQIELPEETNFSECCQQLKEIMLDHNRIRAIRRHWFSNMSSLYWLSLTHNQIEHIEPASFDWDYELEELNLSFNRLTTINRLMFARRLNIQRLYLAGNPLRPLPVDAFREILQLKSLNLSNVEFPYIRRDTFAYLSQLEFIYFAKFRYCHYAHHVRVCRPITDGLSSAQDLLAFPILKYAVWIVASVCSLGNVFVLIWRSVSTHEDSTLSLFVRNLSLADLMMGVYLGAIGWQDWKFEHKFGSRAIEWMSSWQCTSIGFLATLSSELSVLILTIITVERYRSIVSTSQLGSRQERRRQALVQLALAWLLSFLLAAYPLLEWWLLLLQEEEPPPPPPLEAAVSAGQGYYAANGLCLPLHIDQPFTAGWQYSAFLYLGLNFSAVLLIMGLYLRMYLMIMSGRQLARPQTTLFKSEKREDAILAMRFFLIVVTDCLCWIPIVVIKLMALANVTISSAIYGWLVVFIIPINSALNPIVYTLAAPTSLRAAVFRLFARLCRKLDQLGQAQWGRGQLGRQMPASLTAEGRSTSSSSPSGGSATTQVLVHLAGAGQDRLELVAGSSGSVYGGRRHLLLPAPRAKRASTSQLPAPSCDRLGPPSSPPRRQSQPPQHQQPPMLQSQQQQRHSRVSFASSKDSRSCLLQA